MNLGRSHPWDRRGGSETEYSSQLSVPHCLPYSIIGTGNPAEIRCMAGEPTLSGQLRMKLTD